MHQDAFTQRQVPDHVVIFDVSDTSLKIADTDVVT
jgi:hypothetical protein